MISQLRAPEGDAQKILTQMSELKYHGQILDITIIIGVVVQKRPEDSHTVTPVKLAPNSRRTRASTPAKLAPNSRQTRAKLAPNSRQTSATSDRATASSQAPRNLNSCRVRPPGGNCIGDSEAPQPHSVALFGHLRHDIITEVCPVRAFRDREVGVRHPSASRAFPLAHALCVCRRLPCLARCLRLRTPSCTDRRAAGRVRLGR
jgi:hypothetical protein